MEQEQTEKQKQVTALLIQMEEQKINVVYIAGKLVISAGGVKIIINPANASTEEQEAPKGFNYSGVELALYQEATEN